jgi:hypothetical protein
MHPSRTPPSIIRYQEIHATHSMHIENREDRKIVIKENHRVVSSAFPTARPASSNSHNIHLLLFHNYIRVRILLLPVPPTAASSLKESHNSDKQCSTPHYPAEAAKYDLSALGAARRPVTSLGLGERFRHGNKAAKEEDSVEKFDDEVRVGFCFGVWGGY